MKREIFLSDDLEEKIKIFLFSSGKTFNEFAHDALHWYVEKLQAEKNKVDI